MKCKLECLNETTPCLARKPEGLPYSCTRMLGHEGPHVACDCKGGHEYAVWENSDAT